ncbi:MAG: transcription-repair coupling factor [Acidobacteria bacterium]|nr:transcription-repair coupling factor [Acidobacteriota bacterium]
MIPLKRILETALQSGAFERLEGVLSRGEGSITVSGAAGGAKALVLAGAALRGRRPLAVITPSGTEAQTLAEELRFYLELLAPAPPEVVHLPDLEVDPYRGLSPHPEIAAARARALWRLLQDTPAVLVTSVKAAAVRMHSPERFLAGCLSLVEGEELSPDLVCAHLRETGYLEDDPVTDPGEFSLRGGILDLFPPNLDRPVRLEFFGDQIDSMRLFDPDSQRSTARAGALQVVPMREYCPGPGRLRRWAEEAPSLWNAPFLPHLEEELALARHGEPFPAFEFLLPAVDPLEHTLFDYVRGSRLALLEPEAVRHALEQHHAALYGRFVDRTEAQKPVLAPERLSVAVDDFFSGIERFDRLELEELGVTGPEASRIYVSSQPTRRYHGNIRELIADIGKFRAAGETLAFVLSNLGRAERLHDILKEYDIPARLCRPGQEEPEAPGGGVLVGTGALHAGCFLPASNLRLLATPDVFDEADIGLGPKKIKSAQRNLFLSDFRDLKPGDYVVHVDHGIGMFQGLQSIGLQEGAKEFVLLTYQNDARLYVPVERLDLIQKYSSMGGTRPTLDRLGGTSWARTKTRIKKSMRDMAEELLKLYAQRQTVSGYAFAPDTAWQREFEDAFEFELTRDQADALEAVKTDMEAPRPMDRLLCGDVGYGKTEVAMRAAFKAVMDGKQVAVLAPTTVLAFQHYNTLVGRFTAFPVRIQLLSRFRSPREQKQILEDLDTGQVDLVVGTHRLLSKDVKFKDLGLVIVDEEQRFGVTHKERLKRLKTRVDVLTLTATPIPRTLNMALLGMRDMSTIETPPKNRLAIQTSVLKYSPDVVRSAIEMELARNGQVYYLHNRVETIHSAAAKVQQLLPEARIGVAHGQMNEQELERIMLRFVRNELDVLVATTIIENGLDIPRANTLIVDRADLYGLSQLYQLRGRVGRSDRRAYAYLLIPSDEALSEVARKRLSAIREFSDLGTGFRVAALDLEIRGAGNLLGGEQHGHIETVGFDLYCQLLERAVEELRGEKPEEEIAATINLNLDIRIPETYIADSGQRLRMYKRVSSADGTEELDSLRQEMRDRFGQYPEPVENLFRYARLRQEILALQIPSVEKNRDQVFFRFADHSRVDAQKLLAIVMSNRRATFSPQGLLTLDVPRLPPAQVFDRIHEILEEIRL